MIVSKPFSNIRFYGIEQDFNHVIVYSDCYDKNQSLQQINIIEDYLKIAR